MLKIINPDQKDWLSICKRPAAELASLNTLVATIFAEIESEGDEAIKKHTLAFDKIALESFCVGTQEIQSAVLEIPEDLKNAIQVAKQNIEQFHRAQKEAIVKIETSKGVTCWRESRGIEKVGMYIPGGTAPLFSTVLMLGIPAMLADCKEIVLCTPPDKNGAIHPAILYAAHTVGIQSIFKVGGIQAIGAMTFGTASIPKVYKIFGPGNQYVTAAKQMAQQFGVAIDMPAGPSEVLVIADKTCVPAFVAADLLAQAEHGSDSQVILLTNDVQVLEKTMAALEEQLRALPREAIAAKAMDNSRAILLKNISECLAFSNLYAPEHLILAMENSEYLLPDIINAGSVFVGNYSCESAGDYASGTNHTLPTNGYARNYSGVSLDSFVKKISFQALTLEGLQNIGPSIETMAAAEQLWAHKNAVSIRLKMASKQQSNV